MMPPSCFARLEFNRSLRLAKNLFELANLAVITRAKARVIMSLHDVFFRARLSLSLLDACDYLRWCYWQFSSRISGSSHPTSCSSLVASFPFVKIHVTAMIPKIMQIFPFQVLECWRKEILRLSSRLTGSWVLCCPI